jgi:hypothetical protein
MMETEEGEAEMMAEIKQFFYESDSENKGSLTSEDFWRMMDKFNSKHDYLEGIMGHWIMDKKIFDENTVWYINTIGTGGRMTYDQWMASFPIYFTKILPNLKTLELTDEQIAKWL